MPYRGHCLGEHNEKSPALLAEGLRVAYPGLKEVALEDFSIKVLRGSRTALVGPNGAGKSTLLQAAAGLLPLLSGKLEIFGHEPDVCRHHFAFLPQRADLRWEFPISIERFVLMGRYVHCGWFQRPTAEDREHVAEALRLLQLTPLSRRLIGELSGGQQQRALLARALVHNADLLLLDEPLNAVDIRTREIINDVLCQLRNEGKTVIMATHDLGRLERDFDDAVYLSEGRLVQPPPGSFSPLGSGPVASYQGIRTLPASV